MNSHQLKAYLGSKPVFTTGPEPTPWVRNPDWLPLPTHSAGIQRIDCLVIVGNWTCNPVAFLMRGAYTVNWGDGSAPQNVADNTQAQKDYVYADLDPDTEFTVGGTTFRQALITITPQSGQNLTLVTFDRRHTGYAQNYATPIVDMRLSVPNCTSLLIGGTTAPRRILERVDWLSTGTLTSMANMFNSCTSLQSIPQFPGSVAAVTNMQSMFQGCASLQSIPAFPGSVAAVTNMGGMFQGCASLQSIPQFPGSVAAVTTMASMFQDCRSLQSIPPFPGSVAAVTTMQGMFTGCTSLQTIPPFPGSVAAVTNMQSMFNSCSSLQSIPPFPGSVAAVTTMQLMFLGCASLQTIPPFPGSVAAVTNMENLFNSCSSLQSIPPFPGSVAAVTNMANMFRFCASLQSIPPFPGSVAAVTTMAQMFQDCFALQAIPAFPSNLTALTNTANTFANTLSISRIAGLPNINVSFSVQNCRLGRTEIVSLFNDLADRTATTSANIDIRGNPGVASLTAADELIATSKNWTIQKT